MSTSIPATMTAIEVSEPGGPEVLKPCTRPVPQPGEGEVLIKVAAAGINRPDVFQREGNYPPPKGATDIPGLEVSGTIVALGPGVTNLREGDVVCALVSGGGYAEYCLADAPLCMPVPAGLDMVQAAALPETTFTVWTNVFERGNLKPGESLLVHGGSSGIGTTAIQMASRLGSRVFTTAGNGAKCAACESLGAEKAINYNDQDFVGVVKDMTDGKGVDVILDMVGGDYIPRNIKALAADGRLVNIAYLQGSTAEVNFMMVMLKRLTLTGSTLRPQPVARKAEIAEALKEKVWPLINDGQIKPVIHATYPLAEAATGHKLMESSHHIGKIVLTP